MPRTSYQDELATLRGEVGAMADLTLDRYWEAVEVLESGDPQQAQRIIDGDTELNDWYLDIERECIDLIALQQPLASDLRFVASSFKIVTDLERIGDLACNLAEYGRELGGTTDVDVEPIARLAGEMVEAAMAAYTTADADTARSVVVRDEQLDGQCKRASETIVRQLVTDGVGAEPIDQRLQRVSRLLVTIRDIERVGDHAVNIAARTQYMIENDDDLIY
ncbi:phosphate signaling complex protein PhoU [Halobacteriaceae archaeon SHR40]|uniref:phosphate signaling complex protein PhoU n=1 Tax=Halovenus amylolytica TaxID=2500550 RepID=UPI000FE43603